MNHFNCTRCGKCCSHGSFMGSMWADEEDLQRWEEADRQDILATAFIFSWGDGIRTADLWFNSKTGEEVLSGRCPWLRKQRKKDIWDCRIHELRPNTCRNYPVDREHRDFLPCPGSWEDEQKKEA